MAAAKSMNKRGLALRAFVLASLTMLVLSKRHDLLRSWHELRVVSGIGLITLLGVTALQIVCRALVVRSTVPDLQVRHALLVSEASLGSQNSLLGGSLVSGGLRVSMLRSWGVAGEPIALSLLASSVFAQYALWLLALLFSASAMLRGMPGALPTTVAVAATAVLAALTFVGWLLLFRSAPGDWLATRADGALARARRRIRRTPDFHLVDRVAHVRASAQVLLRERGWRILGLSIASQLALAVVLVVSLRAFHVGGHVVTIPEALTAFALVRVAASITPSPGGLGVTEAGLAHLLSTAGGPSTKVLAAVLTYRACTYLLPIPLGAASIGLWRHRLRLAQP